MMDEYIRLYGKRLYGLCLTLCASAQEAEDLYQETWLKAFRYLDRYDKNREFEPWLTKICVNTYRNTLQRLARSPFFDRFATSEEKQALLEAAPVKTEEGQDYEALHEAIDRLPEKLRVAVILFYFRDMDLISAAQALGIPTGTMKSRLHKARRLLKEVLQDETELQF